MYSLKASVASGLRSSAPTIALSFPGSHKSSESRIATYFAGGIAYCGVAGGSRSTIALSDGCGSVFVHYHDFVTVKVLRQGVFDRLGDRLFGI